MAQVCDETPTMRDSVALGLPNPAAPRSPRPLSGPPATLALLQPPLAQALRLFDLLAIGAALVGPRHLERRRQALEARLGEERGEAAAAHLAVADVGVTIAAGAEPRAGVVDVHAAQSLQADLGVGLVEDGAEMLGIADVESLHEQVAGIEAETEALVVSRKLDQPRGLVEVAAEQPPVPRGLLEQQRASLGSLQRLLDHGRSTAHRARKGLSLRGAGVEDDAGSPDPVADPQRVGK